MPNLYIIAGPNGAGKTTFAKQFLPNYAGCLEFVNADLIAAGLSPFSPERVAIKAGKLMLERIRLLADQGADFAFETTLSGTSYLRLLNDLRDRGYRIHVFFLWISDAGIAVERIADRVNRGGHDVPEDVVRRRFNKGLFNFFHLYRPLADFWAVFDNSTSIPSLVAFEEENKLEIIDGVLFDKMRK